MDTYSKCVLTVIAVCLVWLCLREQSPITTAQAQMGTSMATLIKFPKELYDCDRDLCWLNTREVERKK